MAYHAGLDREHRARCSALPGRRRPRHLRHERVRNGRRQAERAHGRARERAGVARGLLPGGGPRRARRGAGAALLLAENRDKALHVHFIKREEVDPGLPGWLADRLIAAADGEDRYSLDAGQLVRDLRGDGERLRALIGHLTRAGVIAPSPSAPDRVAGRVTGRFDGRAAALCGRRSRRARARWRQYREIWAYVEGHLPAHGDPAPLRRRLPGGRQARLLRRLRPGAHPAAPPPDGRDRQPRRRDPLGGGGARPAVGRTTCAEILHGSRARRSSATRTTACRPTGVVAHAPRRHPRARGPAHRAGSHRDDGRSVSCVLRVA